MTPRSITPAQARSILGLSRSRFDTMRHELRPIQYIEGGRRVYDLQAVLDYRERHRERQVIPGRFRNEFLNSWL